MISIFNILLFLLLLLPTQKDPNYNKQGKPSTYGINTYIKNNQLDLIKEYEYRVDSLYDVYLFTDNLDETSDIDELGEFYLPDNIVITNREKFVAYEFKDLSKFKQKTIAYNERTVKAVVFHELTHAYFNQVLIMMKNNNQFVSPEYGTFRIFPNPSTRFGPTFIEEGICEYMAYHLNESSPIKNLPIPDNEIDLLSEANKVNNIYCYSVIFLQDFLDKYGIKRGMEMLIGNKPPTYYEILHPKLFFDRLK